MHCRVCYTVGTLTETSDVAETSEVFISAMRKILLYLVAYTAWFAASAGAIVVLLLARGVIAQLSLLALLDRYDFRLADQVGLLILGLVSLVLLILCESYFREGVERGVLGQRVLRVFAVEGVLAAVLYIFPLLLAGLL